MNNQYLVACIQTVITTSDIGRYVEVLPINNVFGYPHSTGVVGDFFAKDGKRASGMIVDMREEMVQRKFPLVREGALVLDTRPVFAQKQFRMAKGGITVHQNQKPSVVVQKAGR